MPVIEEVRRGSAGTQSSLSEVPYLPADLPVAEESFEDWAKSSHLKSVTLEVLRNNDIDDMATVRLLNSDDIKKLPIKLGQAKLLEYAVKKLKRSDSLNNSKDTSGFSRNSSPERQSDSFYIVPSPNKSGRKSPAVFSQVAVDEDPDDPENSPCTIRITIETKNEDEPFPDPITSSSYFEEPHRQSQQSIPPFELPDATMEEENGNEVHQEEVQEETNGLTDQALAEELGVEELEEELPAPVDESVLDQTAPEGEVNTTRHDVDLEVKGEGCFPPPPPETEPEIPPPAADIEVPAEVNRVILECNESDMNRPAMISADRRELTVTVPQEDISNAQKQELIKNAARRIVAESIASNGGQEDDEQACNDHLKLFFSGAYGSTLIRLSNDQGTLKFLVPQLAEACIQTSDDAEEDAVEEEGAKLDDEQAGENDGDSISGELVEQFNDGADSISGELAVPLEADEGEDDDRMPDPPMIDEPGAIQRPVGIHPRESVDYTPGEVVYSFHTPKEVNRFGNYCQVQMLGEDLKAPQTTRRPMSPVVSQPIRWECNREDKGRKSPSPAKKCSPVRHRTPSPQRFKSPDRQSTRARLSNGSPGGSAYKATGEINKGALSSPPKEIVNKIRNNIETTVPKSPPKPRSPSPVKPFDTDAFKLARKLAQEVADCPPDCIMVRVRDIQKCPKALLPPELNKQLLEDYISDTEFGRTFGMSRAEFAEYSEWKQLEIKKELGLF